MQFDEQIIANGTGFFVEHNNNPYFITNRHNVTGRNNDTGRPLSPKGSLPNTISILHSIGNLSYWEKRIEPLFDKHENPLWLEHPILREKGDFVALPLTNVEGVDFYPYFLGSVDYLDELLPTDMISVVGFPFGLTAAGNSPNKIAIWATGFIASEPKIDYEGLPIFLIDCRTRQGQSGSAVVFHRNPGAYTTKGGLTFSSQPTTKLLGVYSGRINSESDLGKVWKIKALKELLNSILN